MTKPKSSNPRYAGERIVPQASYRGIATRIVIWYNSKVGAKKEVACSFQVSVRGQWHDLARYDSCHRVFHRHRASWPEAAERDKPFPNVPMSERGAVAIADILNNYTKWLDLIPKEVIDDENAG